MSNRRATDRVWSKFAEKWGLPPEAISYAPGRVNLIGDHTDYNGGLALPAPVNRWVYVGARRNNREEGPGFQVHSEQHGAAFEWRSGMAAPAEGWMRFVHGAYQVWAERFGRKDYFHLHISGDIPQGVGLSSSAALSVALLKAFSATLRTDLEPIELCKMAQRVEHEFLGVETGLLDQMAVVFGQKGKLLEIDFRDLSYQHHDLPPLSAKWVVVDSGMSRQLAHSGYQERVEETRFAFSDLLLTFPELQHPRDVTLKHLNLWLYPPDGLPGPLSRDIDALVAGSTFSRRSLFQRVRHFISENERVGTFRERLLAGDAWAAGDVLDESHQSLRDDYASSSVECDWLQAAALRTKGCMGSRIMGGGFGGCTLNMVVPERAELFLAQLLGAYKSETGHEGSGFIFEWSNGAGIRI